MGSFFQLGKQTPFPAINGALPCIMKQKKTLLHSEIKAQITTQIIIAQKHTH